MPTHWRLINIPDSKDPGIDIDWTSIRHESVGLIPNRCWSWGLCCLGWSFEINDIFKYILIFADMYDLIEMLLKYVHRAPHWMVIRDKWHPQIYFDICWFVWFDWNFIKIYSLGAFSHWLSPYSQWSLANIVQCRICQPFNPRDLATYIPGGHGGSPDAEYETTRNQTFCAQ